METLEERITDRKEIVIDLTDAPSICAINATYLRTTPVTWCDAVMIPPKDESAGFRITYGGTNFNAIAEHYQFSDEPVKITLLLKDNIQTVLNGRINSIGFNGQDNVDAFGITFC